jgi:hypothetical protein
MTGAHAGAGSQRDPLQQAPFRAQPGDEIAHVRREDLRAGDVLLSRSPGPIADLLCALDQSPYSHAGLWSGERALAATPKGVRARHIDRELERRSFIDVYRFRFYDHQLGEPGWPSAPLTAAAEAFLDQPVVYHELYLAGLLLAIGRRPDRDAKRAALELLSDRIAEFTQNHITQHKKRPIVGAELVASAFWLAETTPAHRLGLSIRIDGRRRFTGLPCAARFPPESPDPPKTDDDAQVDADYDQLAQDCGRLLLAARPELASTVEPLQRVHAEATTRGQPLVVVAGGAMLPLACMTPWDLSSSPSLERVGRLTD